jgi:hypothetical protein
MKQGDTAHIIIDPFKAYKIHIVRIVYDAGRKLVVYKWYGKHKQWWHYNIEYADYLKGKILICKEQLRNGSAKYA